MKFETKIIGIAIILMVFAITSVSALDDPKTVGYTNQYVNTTPTPATTGQFFGHIRAATNVFSNQVVIIGPNMQKTVPVNPDGSFEATNLAPGKYYVYLADGNGGQIEQSTFTIGAGATSTLDSEILGHAFSGDGKIRHEVVIISAKYGMTSEVGTEVPESYKYVGCNRGNYDLVEEVAAYDEYVYAGHNHGAYDKQFDHGRFTYVFVGQGHGDYNKIHHNAVPAHYVNVGSHHGDYVYVPAHMDYSTIGSYADVTTNVQSVVNNEVYSFKFDNARIPGGIFSEDNELLSQIADPAPGQVKKVTITYTLNGGGVSTLTANEYEVITI